MTTATSGRSPAGGAGTANRSQEGGADAGGGAGSGSGNDAFSTGFDAMAGCCEACRAAIGCAATGGGTRW